MNMTVEKGDIVAMRDGRRVEVLSVRLDGDALLRFDYIDRQEVSPMRRTAYPSEMGSILRKAERPPTDPKKVRVYDEPVLPPTKVEIVNQDVGPQVHPAVKAPAKPVLRRVKTDTDKK